MAKITVAVLMGGRSSEHEVSLKSGEAVMKALDKERYDIVSVVIPKDGAFPFEKLLEIKPDAAFIALHGKWGEDGTVQGLLELMSIPYTGSGVLGSALAMDKIRSMDLYQFHGLSVPEYIALTHRDVFPESFGLPCVVKPNDGGSSVGVSIVKEITGLQTALAESFKWSETTIIQKYIRGQEATCGVLELLKGIRALPPVHIVPKAGEFFDLESKYAESGSDEIVPADFEPEVIAELQQIALKAHEILGCRGYSRTDFIISEEDGEIFTLETNSLPGFTSASLMPKEAKADGISFPQLLDIIIQNALNK